MTRLLFVLCVGFCIFASGTIVEGASSGVPVGAFVTQPVSSPVDLANLIISDPVAAARFSKHFGMDSGELAVYIHNHMSLSTLPKTERYTVYYIFQNEQVVSRTKELKAGTPVIVDAVGKPVLELSCGNPMTKSLSSPKAFVLSRPEANPEDVAGVIPGGVDTPLEPLPLYAENIVVPPPPVEHVLPSISQLVVPLAVPMLLGATAVSGSKVIPEPASMLVLGMGLAGMALRYRGARKK